MSRLLSVLLLALPFCSLSAFAKKATPALNRKPAHDLPQFRCQKEVLALADTKNTVKFWIEQGPVTEGKPYRSATMNFGTWAEVVIKPDNSAVLYFASNKSTDRYEFDAECKTKKEAKPGMDFHRDNKAAKFMSDADLQAYMTKKKNGMIYVWSPGMTYSMKFFPRFTGWAKKMKLDFLSIVDPRSQPVEVTRAHKDFGTPLFQKHLNSVELYMRNVTLHYPAIIFYKNGRILDPIMFGVVNESELDHEYRLQFPEGLAAK